MKKIVLILLIGFSIVQSCKKDNTGDNNPVITNNCSNAKFQISISDLMTPV